jgi:hypothetical protein
MLPDCHSYKPQFPAIHNTPANKRQRLLSCCLREFRKWFNEYSHRGVVVSWPTVNAEHVCDRDPCPLQLSCSLASCSIQKPIQPRPRRVAYRLDLPPSIASGRPANDRGLDQEVLGLSLTGRQFDIHRHHHSLCDRMVSRRSPAGYRQIPKMPFPVETLTMIQKGVTGRNALPCSNGIVFGHLTLPGNCASLDGVSFNYSRVILMRHHGKPFRRRDVSERKTWIALASEDVSRGLGCPGRTRRMMHEASVAYTATTSRLAWQLRAFAENFHTSCG